MRCPSCGARNPDSAAWCTQCYQTFADEGAAPAEAEEASVPADAEPDAADHPDADPGGTRGPDAPVGPAPVASATGTGSDDDGTVGEVGAPVGDAAARDEGERFRGADGGLEWRCAVCSSWNPLEASACSICGAPFGRTVADEPETVVDRDATTVLLLSAVLPGAGHLALGRTVDGVVRAVMYVLWLAGALALLRAAAGTPAPALPAAPLGIGALALWVLSALDAVGLAEGSRDQLLTPRVFLWLVVGVVGALIAAFIPGMLQITDVGGG